MKFPAADLAALERRLAARGAVFLHEQTEADHYFNAPDRDFARTDEALRVRRVERRNRVTYKGPKRDAQTKTRTEIEVALEEGDRAANDFMQILRHLGYRPVAVVRKRRRSYRVERNSFELEITLDDVERVGRFVELEIQAPEERLEAARAEVLAEAAELGLSASERRSYLELLLAQSS